MTDIPEHPPSRTPSRPAPRITVLLALCNGATHLDPQMQSYCAQSLKPTRVMGSDDGSTDDTRALFDRFGDRAAQSGITCTLTRGPCRGLTANFFSLLACAGADADYVALSDQDDIWLPDKLASAVTALAPHRDRPALLGTRSWEWDAARDVRRLSRPVPEPHDFRHALVQNFAGGNTMMLNRAGLDLVQRALPRISGAAVHDWWLYQLVSGAGGKVILDQTPHILYRQHARNQIGANASLISGLTRFGAMLNGTYRGWNDLNIAALQACDDLLNPEARALLARVARDRHGPLPARLAMLRATGVHRKGRLNHAVLWLTAALNRL